jgi:hypothetical protein
MIKAIALELVVIAAWSAAAFLVALALLWLLT